MSTSINTVSIDSLENKVLNSYKTLKKFILEFLQKNVKKKRLKHILGTAIMVKELCNRFGIPEEKGYIAGLSHDIARDLGDERIIDIVKSADQQISELEAKNPVLLHGKAGAVLLERDFHIRDEDILEAVQVHTLGMPGMGDLAKIVFCADYIECSRRYIKPEFRNKVMRQSLHEMVCSVIEHANKYSGNSMTEQTLELYNECKEERFEARKKS